MSTNKFDGSYLKYVGWVAPYDLYVGDILDLSQELTAYNGSAVTVRVKSAYKSETDGGTGKGAEISGNNGKFLMEAEGTKGMVYMACASMPNFVFYGEYQVGGESSAIAQLPLGGMELTINDGVVSVIGMADDVKAALYDTSGRIVGRASGGEFSIAAPNAGVYILRMSDTQGRTSAVKLMTK